MRLTKLQIIDEAKKIGFDDIGFTTADPFESQKAVLAERRKEYAWTASVGMDLAAGTDPENILPGAKSIIVVLELYFRQAFPKSMERYFGRCYLDDDRVIRDGLAQKITAFKTYLRKGGLQVKIPPHLPHRLSAARAGLGTFGKNCLLYANRVARKSSFVLPIAFVVDGEFEPDSPTVEMGCPSWCKNVCLTACPTSALKGPRKIDPRRCISYLSYYGRDLTPVDMREPMGLWVYGCDCCQNVCPRNASWLAAELPENSRVSVKADDFHLPALLHMDRAYFKQKIWPHMFYMSADDLWRWKMNVARVMGNTLDPAFVPDLIRAFGENNDERVQAMCAWSLGKLGGRKAGDALARFLPQSRGRVAEEIQLALGEKSSHLRSDGNTN